ncbi:hypothetical protein BDR07DRAFT_1405029 [Suillus spraguei]|nr:hypothetical protein BDR07DRAFT_1405029 [Suillus spraguei]
MDASTGACKFCASNGDRLPLTITSLQGAIVASPKPSSGHASMIDDHNDLLPKPEQPTLNPNNCVIIIQNNHIAEGGTINIFSSRCNGATVTKLNHVTTTVEPTPLQLPPAKEAEPVEHGRESIVLNGNTFGECVMINIGSPDCTGAVKQIALASQE